MKRIHSTRFSAILTLGLSVFHHGLLWSEPATQDRIIAADVNVVAGPLNTSFKECVGAGRANEGLRADWQEQLRQTRKDCGFRTIRMHGLLSDDMGVYREDAQGNPTYNWQYIDRLYDFLLSIGIRPFVELSFMPKDLASGTQTVFWWRGNITPPKSNERWAELIRKLTQHFEERYGRDEVKSWRFEVWNEPNLHNLFFTGTQDDYFKLYETTARAIKSVSADYSVGGPATAGAQWGAAFIDFCHKNQVPLDFISTHTYGVKQGFLDTDGRRGTVLDTNPNSVIGSMTGERREIARSPLPDLPLHFTEWSSSYTPTDFFHDTYQEAAYILSKVKGVGQSVDSMSYWTFSDIFEEMGPRMTPFHGGFGLVNYQDLKKPAYYAYKFLHELGPTELKSADSASFVCRDADGAVQALFWNFTPVGPPEGVNDQEFFRHEIPAQKCPPVQLRLTNLPAGSYRLAVYRTGHRLNDVFTSYLDLGAPSQLTRAQVNGLREKSNGEPESAATIQIDSGKPFVRTFELRQNDVYFVKISREKGS